MTNKFAKRAALLGLLAAAASAQALTVSQTHADGQAVIGLVLSSEFGPSLLAADIGFGRAASVSFDLTLDAVDEGQSLGFNAVISALNGHQIEALEVRLSGAEFAWVGSLTPAFADVAAHTGDAQYQRYVFGPAEGFGIDLGRPFAQVGASDWQISSFGLKAGDTVTLSISSAVPEPASWSLLMVGAALLLAARARASQH
ncbi:MAG: PEP-CTERM sorting domain-containing protein [Paucibacter sp.]|nr:PEP-CTERM sorting domain-containing protein [Roseateles sp.]